MVKTIKYTFVLFFVLCMGIKGFANHIIGGEMYYDYLGSNNYKITLKIYRDCDPVTNPPNFDGTPGLPIALLHVFDVSGNVINQIDLGAPVITRVQGSIHNPCIITSPPCVEEGVYTYTINLPPQTGGYTLVYQRCCRNGGILNLLNGNTQGSSYTAFIPGPELAATNSSPRFTNFPPIDICNNLALNFDHSATDADGDQLVYSFTTPFDGLDACCAYIGQAAPGNGCSNPPPNCPAVASPPPYPLINYINPFNSAYPVASNPSLTINSATGLLQGTPNLLGKYVVGVVCEEYRNGNLLSKHYRDFQFVISNCTVTAVAAIADQEQMCQGLQINFTNKSVNQSATPSYVWNFGDPNTTGDTSHIVNPTYTYQDTGVYNVTLILNPGAACSDTIVKKVYVYPPLHINFNRPPVQCVKSNSVNLAAGGVFLPQCKFNWDFSAVASPNTSTLQNPSGINFSLPGLYFIKLIATQYACIDTFIDSIRVLSRPIAKINNFPTKLCDPGTVAFSNGSISEYPCGYRWLMSDGTFYSSYEPSHQFSPAGIYGTTLTLLRGAPCPDTSITAFNAITIHPKPVANFLFTPSITTIFASDITFQDTSSKDVKKWNYNFGDGFSSSSSNPMHTYNAPGTFTIIQTVTNTFDCTDQTQKEITILPEFRFWAPNAFTPDDNNRNDVFLPIVIGVHEYHFDIFDKWGHVIFSTTDTSKGWDGKLKGKPCRQDVYVWKITYLNDVTQKHELKTGHVTLLNSESEF